MRTWSRQPNHRALLCALVAGLVLLGSCASYALRFDGVRQAVESADLDGAYEGIDRLVRRAEDGRRPERFDLPLLLLERASIAQALGWHEQAVADLNAADQMMEVLDLTPQGMAAAAGYLFSDDLSLYRPPVYEKLLINLMAMASYLHLGNFSAAMVEARRTRILLDYFRTTEVAEHPMLATAHYLAGLTHELTGDLDAALLFYTDAWQIRPVPGLAESMVRLRGRRAGTLDRFVDEAMASLGLRPDQVRPAPAEELVIIVFSGLGPRRVPEYLPVGAVFAMMADDGQAHLSAEQQRQYNELIVKGLLTWVNYPVLTRFSNPLRGFTVRSADQGEIAIPMVADIEAFALQEWERVQGRIAWAAITRALTRIVAREATEGVARAADLDSRLFPGASLLAGLIVQGAMQATDRPDTRNWTMMPAGVHVLRLPVTPGEHHIVLAGYGERFSVEGFHVTVPPNARRVVTWRAIL